MDPRFVIGKPALYVGNGNASYMVGFCHFELLFLLACWLLHEQNLSASAWLHFQQLFYRKSNFMLFLLTASTFTGLSEPGVPGHSGNQPYTK